MREHEEIIDERLEELMEELLREKVMKFPLLVDRGSFTVLDGHHRLNAARILGLKKIPVLFIDYFSDAVEVVQRREDIEVSKELVVKKALSKELFPPKSTKHILKEKLRRINMPLSRLA